MGHCPEFSFTHLLLPVLSLRYEEDESLTQHQVMTDNEIPEKQELREWYRTPEQKTFLNTRVPCYLDVPDKTVFSSQAIEEWFLRWPESEVLFGKPSPNDAPLDEEQKLHRKLTLGVAIQKRREVGVESYLCFDCDAHVCRA